MKASTDTGACYGVKECPEIVFKRGTVIKGEGLAVLEEKMEALGPKRIRSTNFLDANSQINKRKIK